MSTRDEETLLRLAKAVAEGTPVDWEREAVAQPGLRPQLEKLRALAGIAALNAEEAPDPLIGQTLSHYRIRERIGAGGMGVVYRAEDRSLHRPVALKVLPPDLVSSDERRRRLLREARAEAAVVHPSIAAVHEVGEVEGNIFIAMEWVEGETLRERIGGRPMPLSETLSIAAEMAEGLAHAHQAHVIHRDLKPANVVVRPDGHVKILDFGLAKLMEDEADSRSSEVNLLETLSAEVTGTGKVMGTPAYMSPEQVRGEPLDARSDIFSFGSTLYEMATGSMPFRGESSVGTLASILRGEPVPPRQLNPEVPRRLEAIIGKCLHKDPQDRYSRADEVAAELRALARGFEGLEGQAILEARPPPPTSKHRPKLRRWSGVAAALIVLLGAAVATWRHLEPAPGGPPAAPSIAVLRFDNLGQDPANEAFTEGIHHDILTQLSKIRALKVIARTSIERLDPNWGIEEIGTRLGVTSVLEGGVQRVGGRVRINVQLIDCATQTHLWAETYDRELTAANIFAIQSDIAMTVASALRAALTMEEQERVATIPTQNLAAYQAYLLGKQRLAKRSVVALAEAVGYFRQAIEIDPSFALAHVGLADSYVLQVEYYSSTDLQAEEMLAKAQAAAEKALDLDDRLGEACNSLGGIKELKGDFQEAEMMYQRALELNPNYAMAYHWYGALLSGYLDRHEEALLLHKKAIELDPFSAITMGNVADDLHALGRFEESLSWYENAIELEPGMARNHAFLGLHLWTVSGKLDEALVSITRSISLEPGDGDFVAVLGTLFLDLGDVEEAEYWIERSQELGRDWPDLSVGLLHLYRSDEVALDYARKALADFPSSRRPVAVETPPGGWIPLLLLRNHELDAGRYAEARALYERVHPELLSDHDPSMGRSNWKAAVDLASVLLETGEKERAHLLLNRSLRYVQTRPRLGTAGYGWADAEIFALQGEKRKALSALRQAIDEGWRRFWWYYLERDPNLESLHGEPEFQAMLAEIKADMAAQLERVREMERVGELPVIPRNGAW